MHNLIDDAFGMWLAVSRPNRAPHISRKRWQAPTQVAEKPPVNLPRNPDNRTGLAPTTCPSRRLRPTRRSTRESRRRSRTRNLTHIFKNFHYKRLNVNNIFRKLKLFLASEAGYILSRLQNRRL